MHNFKMEADTVSTMKTNINSGLDYLSKVGGQANDTEFRRPNNLQRIAQNKNHVQSFSRDKKIEKLATYSSCKVNKI